MSIVIKIVLLLGLAAAAVATPVGHVVAPVAHAEGSPTETF